MRIFLLSALAVLAVPVQAQQPVPQWELVEELRIGSIDGPDALTSVQSLVVSPGGGEVFVGQHREHLIRVLDARRGRILRTIGRRGQGPGEFAAMGRLSWKGDTLAVRDGMRRVSLFLRSKEHVRTQTLTAPHIDGSGAAVPLAYLSDGTALAETERLLGAILRGGTPVVRWAQLDRGGSPIRTIAEEDATGMFGAIQFSGRVFQFGQPMSTTTFVEPAPDGSSVLVVYAEPALDPDARVRILRLAVSGDTIYDRSFRVEPQPVPPERLDPLRTFLKQVFPPNVVPSAQLEEAIREHVHIPPALPPVKRVTLAPDGSAWIARDQARSDHERWDLLAPDGRLRATVRGPTEAVVRAVSSDGSVWATVADELDVTYVVRFLVRPAP